MGTFNMWSKEELMQVKEAIIRMKKIKQTYQRDVTKFRNGQINTYKVRIL